MARAVLSGWRWHQRPPLPCPIFVTVVALFLSACGLPTEAPEACGVSKTSSAIINGSETAALFALSGRAAAIVAVTPVPLLESKTLCSGVRVTPQWVLSAAHCVASELWVASEPSSPEGFVAVDEVVLNSEVDLALLRLEGAADNLGRFPVVEALPDGALVGRAVQVAGFGMNETGEVGLRRTAVQVVVSQDQELITVTGEGISGACLGDSGGPLLVRADDGRVRVAGILSRGSLSCVGHDQFVALAGAREWIENVVGALAFEPNPGCDGLDAIGQCVGNVAARCQDGAIRVDVCNSDQLCSKLNDSKGYTCVPKDEASCGGVGPLGRCDADVAQTCRHGKLISTACGECGLGCALDPATGVPRCAIFND